VRSAMSRLCWVCSMLRGVQGLSPYWCVVCIWDVISRNAEISCRLMVRSHEKGLSLWGLSVRLFVQLTQSGVWGAVSRMRRSATDLCTVQERDSDS
jgi:hypothetical protein